MKIYRITAIVAALLGGALLSRAEQYNEPPGLFFAKDRGQAPAASPFGTVPRKITAERRVSRLRNAAIVEAAARRHGVPAALARNLARQESGFNHLARSPVGAMGLTQVMPGTWRSEGCSGNPWNPEHNADCGMRYLAKFYRVGGAHYAALRYHGGPNIRAHGRRTRAYAQAVAGGLSSPPKWAGSLQMAWR